MKPCYWLIETLPGLSLQDQTKLQLCGITNTQQLLQQTSNREKINQLANKLQIKLQYLQKWVALADLARIPSVGCQYCGLILHAGIASVNQLTQTPPHKLHQQMLRLQVAMMQRRDLCPSVDQVKRWVDEAKWIMNN